MHEPEIVITVKARKRWDRILFGLYLIFGCKPRYKKYAAWPVVLWCRLMRHRGQPTWDSYRRCLRCGDFSGTTTEGRVAPVTHRGSNAGEFAA